MKAIYTIQNFAKRLVMVLAVGLMAVNVWGGTTVSASFKSSGSYSTTLTSGGSITWTSDVTPTGWVSWSCGSTTNTVVLSSSTFSSKYITKVSVTCRRNKSKTITASVTVGGNAYGGEAQTTAGVSGTDYTLDFTDAVGVKGNIAITLTSPGGTATADKGSLIVSDITIIYEDAPLASCTSNATVAAGSNSSVTTTTATISCTGGITSLGSAGCSITSYGFALNTTGTPTISDTKHQVGTSYTTTGTGFSKDLTGLTAGTTYYVRPYATNGNGTAYGTQTTFTTLFEASITLDKNGGSANGSAKAVENATSLSSISAPTRTGYNLEGYYTTAECATKIATSAGAFQSGITVSSNTWTNGSSQWKRNASETFYAKWTAKTYTVNLNGNGATTDGSSSVTLTYNSASHAAITNPKKTDYIFNGWYSGSGGTGSLIIDASGVLQSGVAGYTDASGNWTKDATTTLYAKWTEHTYTNYRTLCCTKYDITLASSGSKTGGSFEVDPAKACEGTEITLIATADDGYEFSAWTITNDDDDDDDVTTTVLASGDEDKDAVEFDMPAYNITIDAEFTCTEPTISAQPSGASYTQGDAATALSVTASAGTGTLDYQWQSSSDNSSWDDIDDEDGSTFTPPTSSTGTMYYRVVVTNTDCSESVESDAATITVSAPSVCKTPTFSVSAGTYSSAQSVELSCGTDGATIRYTTNGDDPTESSSAYSSAISVSVNTTIKAKAFKAEMTASSIASATYNIRCAAPTFSLDEDIYVGSQSLTMSSATTGATVRYTTDESEPTGSSTAYSSALTVSTSTTYKAKAYKDGMTESEESEVYVMIQCATPTFSVSAGTYNANQSVSISTTYGTTIYYTLDGSTPDTKSSTYSSAITIDATKTLKAIAVKSGCEDSDVASATYTLKCATPTFSPVAGTYTGAQSVSMSCATTGSAIHYTTNGTDPTGSSATYSSAISVGTNQTVKAIATKTGWSDSEVASAAYTIKYNVAVASVDNVTISATTPSVAEGSSAAAAYGSTVSLSYSGVASGKTWGGWNVYKTGDASTTVTVTSNQFTMPAYNVTVSAIIYGDAIAWCDPDVEVTGDIHLTSYKDVPVYATSGADNLIEISSGDMGSATKMEVAYLNADAADAEVDKASSLFRFYNAAGTDAIDAIDLDYEWGTSHSIRYTPSAYGVTNNYKLKLMFKRGDKVLKTVTHAIYGRSLPEEFVIACKYNDEWYALPNTMGTSGEDVTPLKITVNNTTTPTAATYAPTTAVYKGAARYRAGSNLNSIRFTKNGSQWLTTSTTMQMSLSETATPTTGVEGKQVWHLKSDDFGAYTLQMDPAQSNTKKLGIYNGKIGLCATPAGTSGAIYLLPITNKYTEIAATVSEWGEHGVIVQPNTPSDLLGVASATMNVGTADPTAATTSAVNAAIGTAKRVKVDGGALTVGAVANDGKLLYIHWKNSGGSEIGVSQIQIPYVVAADGAMKTLIGAKDTWAKKEVHVLPGVTLTADAGSFGSSAVTVPTMHIYPGATLSVSTGTLTATTLRLHNGWTRAGTKKYDVARVYIADDAALTKTTASMDYDIYEQSEGRHFYPLAVPFPVAVSAIDYADTWLAGYSTYGMSGQYVIKEYDGARRANKGPDQVNNWTPIASDATLSPGKGYIMTAVPVYGEAIIRVPLAYNDAWTADGELGTAHYDDADHTKNVIAVTAYEGDATADDKKANKGWNLLGVPFMSCYTTSAGMYADEGSATVIQGKFNFEDGTWDSEDKVRYVNVPVHDFSEYVQTDITDDDTKLLPGWCFFVQIETSGNLTFLTAQQAQNSSLPIYAPKLEDSPVVKTGIILSNGEKSDKTTFLISDKYSAEYEIGEDLEKMFGSAFTLSTYSMMNNTKLAYNALSPDEAKLAIPIGVRIPEDGEYTFSLNPRYEEANIERLDLIDYETSQITNLMTDSYTFTMTQGENTERFAINVTMRKETPTDIETVSGEGLEVSGARKMIINEKLYILRDGMIYDATGKRVSEINK